MNKNISIYIFVYLYSQTTMVTFTRNRKIARSTIRRVKRNKLSKNVKRVLKRKVSKRKVMKGGDGHFKVYLVYCTRIKGLFKDCEAARLPFSVLGVLFYSEVNNDFFYFGYSWFGNPSYFGADKDFFTNKGYNIFYNIRPDAGEGILDEELAFIGHLCNLAINSEQIKSLKSGIEEDGLISYQSQVKCCVNMNKTRVMQKVELKYCSKDYELKTKK